MKILNIIEKRIRYFAKHFPRKNLPWALYRQDREKWWRNDLNDKSLYETYQRQFVVWRQNQSTHCTLSSIRCNRWDFYNLKLQIRFASTPIICIRQKTKVPNHAASFCVQQSFIHSCGIVWVDCRSGRTSFGLADHWTNECVFCLHHFESDDLVALTGVFWPILKHSNRHALLFAFGFSQLRKVWSYDYAILYCASGKSSFNYWSSPGQLFT